MPRKKKPFDKKSGLSFVVAPRSLQDPVLHEEGGSQYVLVPKQVKEKRYDADGKTVASSRVGDRPTGPSRFDEVDEWGMPKDGYDYNQHFRAIQPGGTFVLPGGKVVPTDAVTASVASEMGMPSEAFPSDKVMDRMLDSIVIREERLPDDIRRALNDDDEEDDDDEFEELDDDFMNQAAAEVESDQEDEEDDEDHVEFGGEGFDLDAHIAKLISNAEKQDVGSLRAAGKPIRTIKRKNNAGTESHPRFYKIDESDEDGSQDERGEDDFEEDDMEEDEDRDDEDVNRSRRPLNPMDNAFQRVMMAEYADENIGELDPDDPRVRGTGFHASTLERAMNEFLEMGISDSDDEELLEGARAKARRRKQAGTTACRSDDSDGEDEDSDEHAEDEEEEDEDDEDVSEREQDTVSEMKGTQLTNSVPYGWGADDFSDGEDDAKIVLPRVPRRAKWDCATILSTYTNTENHPRVLADVQVPASASVASKQAFSRATGAPKMIMLSAKTGVPLGVPLRGEPVKKPGEDDKQPSEGGSTSGSNSDGEDKAPVNLGVARSREETAEEKKARKREVKEARKAQRANKKSLKTAFKDEERKVKQDRRKGAPGISVHRL